MIAAFPVYFYLAYIEVKRYFRDPGALGLSLALPIALLALMLGAFGSDPSFHGRATIVDLDKSPGSARLIDLISAVPGVDVEMLEEERADRLLDRSARLLVTVIREGYGDEVSHGGSSPLLEFRQRGSGGDEGSIVASMIRGASAKHAAEEQALRVVTSEAARLGLNASEAEIDDAVASAIERQREAPFVSVEVERTGETTAPFNIFFPGILTMMVMFAVTLNAISIVEERLDGRLERLLITGSGLNGIFAGKFLAGMVRGFLQAFILATLGWAAFRSFGPSDYGGMLVVISVLAAFAAATGMAIASFARTREQANWSAVIITMVMATIGGSFFEPAKGGILDAISRASPIRYGNDALRIVLSDTGGLGDVWLEIAVLGGLTIVLLVVSRQLFSALQGRDG